MVRAFSLSLTSLSDRAIVAILFKSVLLTLAIFALLGFGGWYLASSLIVDWVGNSNGWLASALSAAAAISFGLAGWLLFRVVAVAVIWFFSDDIVEAVERKYYPVAAFHAKRPSFAQSLQLAMRSILRVLGYNLLALPLYLILLVTGFGVAIVFLLVNALLLGRDLEDMLAVRHGTARNHMNKLQRLLLGLAGTAGMMVPVVNLLVPVIATAMAVHLMHAPKR